MAKRNLSAASSHNVKGGCHSSQWKSVYSPRTRDQHYSRGEGVVGSMLLMPRQLIFGARYVGAANSNRCTCGRKALDNDYCNFTFICLKERARDKHREILNLVGELPRWLQPDLSPTKPGARTLSTSPRWAVGTHLVESLVLASWGLVGLKLDQKQR